MSAVPTRRKRVAATSTPRRPTRRTTARRRFRLPGRLGIPIFGALLLLFVTHGWVPMPWSAGSGIGHDVQYTVLPGDTPSSIASAYGLAPPDVARMAGVINADSPLTPGLQLPIDASRLWAQVRQGPRGVNESLVEAEARRLHVEPALAVAVAWQESRLDQSARSSTGAIGIMQVEPDTSSLAARDLGIPLDARLAADNVRAGVFWLHALLVSYGGDRSAALAAYYEGPGNLARRGYVQGTAGYVAHALQLRAALLSAAPNLRS